MALTATATKQLRGNIARVLGMSRESVMARSPSKDNVMFTTSNFKSMEDTFLPVAKKLFDEEVNCHRMIIYCRSFGDCASVYLHLKTARLTSPHGAPYLPMFRVVGMYMSLTEQQVKGSVMANFTSNSPLRFEAYSRKALSLFSPALDFFTKVEMAKFPFLPARPALPVS